ncbi:MAG: apolipoprotein N-acyltransferase [Caulobacteraceae bacterium]|nr:apolipoprotein N-acyltransferase [Caulobacteraceae bacterium]
MTTAVRLLEPRGVSAIAAVLAGAGAALAFPPFGFLVGLLGYGVLMSLLDAADPNRPLRSAFWRGWLAGAVFFLISTWWISEAFFVDAEAHAWQAPFAIAFLAGGLGLFWGLAGLVYRALKPKGPLRVLVFAGVFCLVEWLRGHVLTGFPWDLAGESWRAGTPVSQLAALVGAYGLGWITVAISAAPVLLLDEGDRRLRFGAAAVAALTLAGAYAYGAARLAAAAPIPATAPVVRVVQADIDEEPDYSQARLQQIVDRYVRLTAQPAARTPDIVIWPEGAIPAAANDYLAEGSWTRAAIEGALRPGQSLMVGAYRVAGPPDAPIFFNTLLALREEPGGLRLTGRYDKFRLVPFGEYLPLARVLKPLGINKLVNVSDGFTPGPPPRPIAPEGMPRVQPLICYESLFPGFTRAGARAGGRPSWIVNVSDDAWFGRTYGPLQHLNLASYRAIEEGLPIVRATPTGVSAVIDAYGRIRPGAKLNHGEIGNIDSPLPGALAPTPYTRIGEMIFCAFLIVSLLCAMIGRICLRQA